MIHMRDGCFSTQVSILILILIMLSATRSSASASVRALTHSTLSCVASPSFYTPIRCMAGMAGRDVRMRVILSEDNKLGLKGDIVTVKRGYGRNVLVRQGKAVYATAENIHLGEQAKLRAASKKSSAAPQSSTDSNATSTNPTTEEANEANTAPDVSTDVLRYQMEQVRRITGQRPLTFYRSLVNGQVAKPVTIRDVYVKLVKAFPGITMSQLKFAGVESSAIAKLGDQPVEVRLPGIAKPSTFNIAVKRLDPSIPKAAMV